MDSYTTEQARAKIGEIITEACVDEPVLITYHGLPAAVVVSWEWYQYARPALLKAVVRSSDRARGEDAHDG